MELRRQAGAHWAKATNGSRKSDHADSRIAQNDGRSGRDEPAEGRPRSAASAVQRGFVVGLTIVAAIIIAALSIVQFLWLPHCPTWPILIIDLDVLLICAVYSWNPRQ
ncbi:hypothetical protein EF294_18345 [Gordonia oryzae]|uniref:DUF7144 domain-containing protein n=1 Tax=Gordonia oryzae TaxID=2487349 RepID=A0A3N4G3G4_9ACTN|nr:hypothetical protein [Gordonia oryzae]RPA57479.1 hypothetical protein EF294_18345 [Gordonia oryzae]